MASHVHLLVFVWRQGIQGATTKSSVAVTSLALYIWIPLGLLHHESACGQSAQDKADLSGVEVPRNCGDKGGLAQHYQIRGHGTQIPAWEDRFVSAVILIMVREGVRSILRKFVRTISRRHASLER